MNIGTAARNAGLSTMTVRNYADVGLVAPMGRSGNGYRNYGSGDGAPDCPILNGLAGKAGP